MKKSILLAVLVVSVLTVSLPAATLTDNFNSGLSSTNWGTFQTNAAGAPWTISASTGAVQISKSADNDSSTMYQNVVAGLLSNFTLQGDFSVSIDFDLHTFPLAPAYGWNEAQFKVWTDEGGQFYPLRYTNSADQRVEAFCNVSPYVINSTVNSTMLGNFRITRLGNTMAAYLNNGTTEILLGQASSQLFLGSASVQLLVANVWDYPGSRPNTALDVRFDNFTATADSIIIPEPISILLLGFGGLFLSRRKKN
jgi:hypothetical protein